MPKQAMVTSVAAMKAARSPPGDAGILANFTAEECTEASILVCTCDVINMYMHHHQNWSRL